MASANSVIKKNLERLLKERDWRIVDLENKAQKGRVVHNIMNSTHNPGIDVMRSLAAALNVDIEEFLYDNAKEEKVNLNLLLETCNKVITEMNLICKQYTIKPNNVLKLIKEVYQYSADINLTYADTNHIKWLIQRYYSKK